ncbi:MAG: diacylglycerol kinase family lipid kinase [Clostridiales bacterium]|nr:diacylglycerol kinase family lipid kinase [Clostridiales bacterium]MBS5877407.1 diacylglycerol kinase family lipid kinase [Clostridiales bacterium]MDU0938743.1 diacylglycerol kinase family lipid kinase [Clostridiales bacterium]MDU1041617.1 diacylglycerol kinase family lipid kinase [Clostridiales bacterium]MDU3490911.1 diacylglycerol kinase family lipid kinase [Clostridiales bacterium]
MKKLLFVFNPKAGKGKIAGSLMKILQIFSAAGYQVSVYPTRAKKDAYNYILANEADFDILVCAGGDGTLNEVVGAMLKNNFGTPLGYIPGGTMNDWAANMGIPTDMIKAAKVIVEGHPVSFDVGQFNDHTNFNYVAAFGAFTDISYATPQPLKKVMGQTAYGVTAIKSLTQLRPYSLRMEYDDGKVMEGKYMFGMACNSKFVGGFKLTGMHTDLHDGKFEIVLIKEIKNPFDINRLFGAAILQDYMNSAVIDIVETSKAKFIFDEPMKWTLDGEYGGCIKEAEVEILPSAINFIIRDKEPVVERINQKKNK